MVDNLYMLVSETMKKYMLKILLFFCVVAVSDLSFGLVCKYLVENTHSGDTARINGLLKKNRYDVMTMGSSRCVCHYNDQMMSDSLGLNVINAGFKGNGIILMYGRYHIIPKDKKPSVLIYDLEPNFDVLTYYNDDNNRRYLSDLKMFYEEDGISDIFHSVDYLEPLKMQSNLYRYNSDAFVLIRNFVLKGKVEYSFFLPTDKQYVISQNRGHEDIHEQDSLKLYYMEKLMFETKADGVKMIVVASPKYGASSKNDLQPVYKLCLKHGVPFWDYYLDMQDTCWFCDNMHLNLKGSIKFTKKIIKRLQTEIFQSNI